MWGVAYGQSKVYIRGDSIVIQKVGGNSNLIIENATKNVTGGVLTNVGNGRTAFVIPSSGGTDTVYRTPGKDSIFWVKNGVTYAFKDSTGGGGGGDLQTTLGLGNTSDTSMKIVRKDSVGDIFNYDFSTGSFSSWTDNTGTGTVTASAGKTTIGGTLALNLSNYLSQTFYIGAGNWTFISPGYVTTQKDNTSFGFGIRIAGTVGSAPDMFAHVFLTDTTSNGGYIAFTEGNALPTFSTSLNSRSAYSWKHSIGDTLYTIIQKLNRVVTITVYNSRTGAKMEVAKNECTVTVGTLSLYFYSTWELIGDASFRYDEVFRPDIAWLGDSNMWGVGAPEYQSYVSQVMSQLGGSYVMMAAPFERALEGTYRLEALGHILPRVAIWGYGVNVDANIDSFSKRTCRFVEFCQANSIEPRFLLLIPQTASSVVIRNDTLTAIATRYGLRAPINITTPLTASTGTAMDALYNLDNVHINSNGHNAATPVIAGELEHVVMPEAPITASPMPISYNPQFVLGIKDGKLVRAWRDTTGSFIKNILYVDGFSNYQVGNIYLNGSTAYVTPVNGRHIWTGAGNLANPNFRISGGIVHVGTTFTVGTGFHVTANQANFPGNTIWSNANNTITTPLLWTVNNPGGSGMTAGFTINNTANNYASDTAKIIAFKKLDALVAEVRRDGNIKAASPSGYYTPLDYTALGANDWITKTQNDSLDALIVAGGGSMSNPMTTTGDMVYSSPGSTPVRLPIGATNNTLRVVAGIPAWTSNTLIENQSASAQTSSSAWTSGILRSDSYLMGKTAGSMTAATGGVRILGSTGAAHLDLGYDATIDGGYIQAINTGVAYKHLFLQPGGFNVGIGVLTVLPTVMVHMRKPNYPAIRFEKTGTGSWYVGRRAEDSGTDFQISYNTTDWINLKITGETGFGGQAASGWVDIAAGTTGIGQLILRSGVVQSSPTSGAMTNVSGALKFYNGAQKRIPLTNDAAPSNGQLGIGNGTDFTLANITSTGNTLTVTNGAGTINVDIPSTIITSGTYTPTLTNTTNVASSTAFVNIYTRVSGVVCYSIKVEVTATGAGNTVLGISIPVASNFAAIEDVIATCTSDSEVGTVTANTTSDIITLTYSAQGAGSDTFYITGQYIITN